MGPDPRIIAPAVELDLMPSEATAGDGHGWIARCTACFAGIIAAQQGQFVLWVPVALGSGVALYFSLDAEPGWPLLVFLFCLCTSLVACAARARRPGALMLVALVVAGVLLAKGRTAWLDTRMLAGSSGPVEVTGWVNRVVNATGNNPRVVLDVEEITGLHRQAWPSRIQMTVFKPASMPLPGDLISISARLFPPQVPVAPGAYDHGRTLWFQGIGATGRGRIVEARTAQESQSRFDWRRPVDRLRAQINASLQAAMPKSSAGFAVALVTGDRSLITKSEREAMATAGLAHILAISGLHMSLVAGGVFWIVRALLALFPAFALRWPIKKLAAVAAFAAATAYLLISGASISTQRAYIMLLIMLLAILLDRPAISMRNLAVAAVIVILIAPESVTTASFQMSFMAVMGLIAAYEALRAWRAGRSDDFRPTVSGVRFMTKWLIYGVLGLAFTTIIAGLFTGLPAAYHFHRFAPYSLLANLLALPVVTFIVMPAAAIGVLLMPLSLESAPLWIMNQGLQYVIWVAGFVTGLDNSSIPVAEFKGVYVLIAAFAAIWLCLARGHGRLIGPFIIAAALYLPAAKP